MRPPDRSLPYYDELHESELEEQESVQRRPLSTPERPSRSVMRFRSVRWMAYGVLLGAALTLLVFALGWSALLSLL